MTEEFLKTQQEFTKLLAENIRLHNEVLKTQAEKAKLDTEQERNRGEQLRNDGIKALYGLQAWVATIGGVGALISLVYVLAKQ